MIPVLGQFAFFFYLFLHCCLQALVYMDTDKKASTPSPLQAERFFPSFSIGYLMISDGGNSGFETYFSFSCPFIPLIYHNAYRKSGLAGRSCRSPSCIINSVCSFIDSGHVDAGVEASVCLS